MAAKEKPEATPLDAYVEGTGRVLTGFATRTAAVAPPEAQLVVKALQHTLGNALGVLQAAIGQAVAAAGVGAEELQEALDSFGAGQLLDDVIEAIDKATTPPDLAVIGTVLPLIKKIIRFIVDITKLQLPIDLDKVLEFIDELAITMMDAVSPKGAEAMQRSEVRFLEAQYHLDRLGSLKDVPTDAG